MFFTSAVPVLSVADLMSSFFHADDRLGDTLSRVLVFDPAGFNVLPSWAKMRTARRQTTMAIIMVVLNHFILLTYG
jgi:hypothetical protein